MALSPTGHTDTFARDHLPPAEQWPVLEFTTEQLRYPERLNAATELIDVPAAPSAPTGPRCGPRTAGSGPTASCSGGPTRSPRC